MRFVLASAVKDLRRRGRDPFGLALWLGIPVLMMGLFHVVFGGSGPTPRGVLLIADEDTSLVSSLVAGAFSQGQLAEMIVVEKVSRDAGRKRLDKGDASALLVIPKGFGQALLNNQPMTLPLVTNPAQRILPGIIEEVLSVMTEAAFYAQSLVGDQLRVFAQGPPAGAGTFPDRTIAEVSVAFNRMGEKLRKYVDPLLIEVETKVIEEKSGAGVNFVATFFPTMLFMSLLFTAQGLSEDVWREYAQGALRRVAATPRRMEEFLLGKLAAAAALVGIITLAALLAGRWMLGIEMRNFAAAWLWLIFGGTSLYLLLLLAQAHASSPRTGYFLTSIVVFPMMMLGGSFFPFESMPPGLAAVGRWMPNGWLQVQFKAILAGAVEPAPLAVGVAIWVAAGAAAFWIGTRRLRRMAAGV